MSNWRIRLAGVAFVASAAWYIPWAFERANGDAVWLAAPFLAATVLLVASLLVSLVNNWQRAVPLDLRLAPGDEPPVAVILTSAGESAIQVETTARSVLEQDWPAARLYLVLSDDGRDPEIERVAAQLARDYPAAVVTYHVPHARGSAERRGEAKAGNLNSALDLITALPTPPAFLETRDADDLVGDPTFLRRCVAQLTSDDRVAFVQTVKEAAVSEGDPFDTLQAHFYRGSMLSRHAANAVFPCGSGVVWRRAAVEDIGGFPTWNLVEDLESGIAAQRRGWRGVYLPIVGAFAQHAPEDIPNVYKQRGTWALDTMRLVLWRRRRGLSIRQRLHLVELGLFYLQSFPLFVFLVAPMLGFVLDTYPLVTNIGPYALHFWPFILTVELYLIALNGTTSYEALWRARQLWVGLAPVYAKACLKALLWGPRRKPVYRVTRKFDEFRWYWRETMPQAAMLFALIGSIAYGAATQPVLTKFDLGSAFWAIFFALILGGFVRKSWFGTRRSPRPAESPRAPARRVPAPDGPSQPAWEADGRPLAGVGHDG